MIANGIQNIYSHNIFLKRNTLSNIYCNIVLLLKNIELEADQT